MAAIQTALNFIKKSKPISPTSTGGVFIHLSPFKQMPYANYQENLLDRCDQRLIGCNQRIEELTQELRKAKLNKIEVYKLIKAIKEVNQ